MKEQATDLAAEHRYTSIACHHGSHNRCRLTCKHCDQHCRCRCHQPEQETS